MTGTMTAPPAPPSRPNTPSLVRSAAEIAADVAAHDAAAAAASPATVAPSGRGSSAHACGEVAAARPLGQSRRYPSLLQARPPTRGPVVDAGPPAPPESAGADWRTAQPPCPPVRPYSVAAAQRAHAWLEQRNRRLGSTYAPVAAPAVRAAALYPRDPDRRAWLEAELVHVLIDVERRERASASGGC